MQKIRTLNSEELGAKRAYIAVFAEIWDTTLQTCRLFAFAADFVYLTFLRVYFIARRLLSIFLVLSICLKKFSLHSSDKNKIKP